MNETELKSIVAQHKLWIDESEDGKRADLRYANLRWANLQGASLIGANLQGADLQGADLQGADLQGANLRGADLRGADLQRADLQRADLQYADLDYSCLPLWCGSKKMKVDTRIASQIAAHFCALDCDDPDYIAARSAVLEFAKTNKHARELGLFEVEE
jgi:uncharacterized protein YjbI with pentapeptide repeats